MQHLSDYIMESLKNPARIFIIIKPGFFNKGQQILNKFSSDGWVVERQISKRLLPKEAKALYKIHKNEDWYEPLWKYMSSDVTTAYILKNNILTMSKDIFDVVGEIKDSIRDEYGESDMRNVMHSSDSLEHMRQEASIYFNVLPF